MAFRGVSGVRDSLRTVLPSIGLPEERCGPARGSKLAPAERELYRGILRSFGTGLAPSIEDISLAALATGVVDAPAALSRMVELDLIQCSDDGAVDCAYPFSARPTGHAVVLADGTLLHAMCAVDGCRRRRR
jgi:hypothetical protein